MENNEHFEKSNINYLQSHDYKNENQIIKNDKNQLINCYNNVKKKKLVFSKTKFVQKDTTIEESDMKQQI